MLRRGLLTSADYKQRLGPRDGVSRIHTFKTKEYKCLRHSYAMWLRQLLIPWGYAKCLHHVVTPSAYAISYAMCLHHWLRQVLTPLVTPCAYTIGYAKCSTMWLRQVLTPCGYAKCYTMWLRQVAYAICNTTLVENNATRRTQVPSYWFRTLAV